MPSYSCEKCSYETSHKGSYDNHMSSVRHSKTIDDDVKYSCDACCYGTNDSSAYAKHCKTTRHRNIAGKTEHICKCGKSFHSGRALTWHLKGCTFEPPPDPNQPNDPDPNQPPQPPQPPEIKALETDSDPILESHPIPQPPAPKQPMDTEMITSIATIVGEVLKHTVHPNQLINNNGTTNTDNKQITTTNSHNQTTNNIQNNNSFNVMLFLNEECADAVDFSDFIYDVEYTQKDLDRAMVAGSVVAISELITREVEKMPLRKRPFHCTDLKRKILYIKEGHWMKDLGGCLPLYNMIKFFKGKEDRTRAIWSIAHDARVQQGYNSCYDYFIRVCDNTTIPFTACHMKKMCKAALEASILNRDII